MQDGKVLCGNFFPTPLDTGPPRHAYVYWVDGGVTEGRNANRSVSKYNEVLFPDPHLRADRVHRRRLALARVEWRASRGGSDVHSTPPRIDASRGLARSCSIILTATRIPHRRQRLRRGGRWDRTRERGPFYILRQVPLLATTAVSAGSLTGIGGRRTMQLGRAGIHSNGSHEE